MILLNRVLVWLSAAAVLVTLEFLLRADTLYQLLIAAAVLNAIVAATIWQFTGRRLRKAAFWNFIITPFFVVNSGLAFLVFLEGESTRQLVTIIVTVAVWIFLKVTFLYFFFRPKYEAHTLENISSYLNLITVFLFCTSVFNLIILLRVPAWLGAIGSMVLVGLLSYQLFWIDNLAFRTQWRTVAVITLVTGELFLAVSFLPTSVYVNALLMTLGYYTMTGLARNWLLNIRERRVIARYLLISCSILVIMLLTAKWI
ncbi:MAG: hypothetical protein A3J59_02555 [Candidatus Buchananbacteria bacterium RIFCSPHIGHO2_02_FULL_56_16]|uniref:Uncharacterized protein n=1 Tax=Candidatus Buchananbacteria bacterium RIFCSPHIGHO2_02_FULL_56_16 TaxID=1797542 RepID=A0A1G1YG48_9BACT|nr:MAG: hypothetical protein A3J59_02555 [Candidatus Buchananbacteria bacterium RIFCSPHIGHO2_02_FULL_56_16]